MSISIKECFALPPLITKLLRRHQLGAGACKFGERRYASPPIEVGNGGNHRLPLGFCSCESDCVRKLLLGNINCCFHAVILSRPGFYFYPFRNLRGESAPAGLKSVRPALIAVGAVSPGQAQSDTSGSRRGASAVTPCFIAPGANFRKPSIRRQVPELFLQIHARVFVGVAGDEGLSHRGVVVQCGDRDGCQVFAFQQAAA